MPTPRIRAAFALSVLPLLVGAAVIIREITHPAFGLDPAPRAGERSCTRLTHQVPDAIAGQDRTPTSVAGVALWGDGAIVLRCGFEPPLPTEDFCANVNGVDWVLREKESTGDKKKLITYGRSPAVEAVVDTRRVAMDAALVDLAQLAAPLPKTDRKCINVADTMP
ncbi:DUF3515 family protein [Streptomyces pathocidini]|uniref:DUF3515 family protein n=1 Tax=Streptomyces pathocidini TaxID=1650571 RepID=UPI0033D90694